MLSAAVQAGDEDELRAGAKDYLAGSDDSSLTEEKVVQRVRAA